MIVFDSHAWIEYFIGSEKGNIPKQYVEGSEEIVTPSLCLAEIKHKYLSEGKDFAVRMNFIIQRSKILNITKDIALLAADKKKEHKLYLADAIVYACALFLGAHVLTGDGHFRHLPEVVFLE